MLRNGRGLVRNFSVFTNTSLSILTKDVEIVRPGTPGSVIVLHHCNESDIESILASGLKTPAKLVQEGKLEGLRAPRLEDRNDVIFFRAPVMPLTDKHDDYPEYIRKQTERGAYWVAVSVNPATTFVYDGYYRKKNRAEAYLKSRTRLLDLFAQPRDSIKDPYWEMIVHHPVIAPEWFVTDSVTAQEKLKNVCSKKQ